MTDEEAGILGLINCYHLAAECTHIIRIGINRRVAVCLMCGASCITTPDGYRFHPGISVFSTESADPKPEPEDVHNPNEQ